MSWYSWWTGSLGPRAKRGESGERHVEKSERQSVALVVGITGMVGSSLAEILPQSETPGGPWKVYGVAKRVSTDWPSSSSSAVEVIECDVVEREATMERIGALKDVTHLFWVARVRRESEEETCEENGRMLQNVLDALLSNAENLQHISLQTGGKYYEGSEAEAPFAEDLPLPRLSSLRNFCHTLEDMLCDAVSRKEGVTWSVHRPSSVMLGFSPWSWSTMSIVSSLSVYAAICKYEGRAFKFPGNSICWSGFFDASDAELVAEQHIWAATSPEAQNQVFNCVNGDVFKWKQLWKIIAERFDLAVAPYDGEGFSLSEAMREKGPTWNAIVCKYGLQVTDLNEVANWGFADSLLNASAETLHCMNKSKEFDFFGFRNTRVSVQQWIERMRAANVVP